MSRPYILVPLLGGIGNIIQTIPFMFEAKRAGLIVVGVRRAVDFPESELLIAPVCDKIIMDRDVKLFLQDHAESCVGPLTPRYNAITTAEWLGWFKTYSLKEPNHAWCGTAFSPSLLRYDVGICPSCKDNWVMKKYPHWPELVDMIAASGRSVAVFGQEKDGVGIDFSSPMVTDTRGQLTLMEVAGSLRNCGITIANEGGLAHLSAAQGTRTYILMGGTRESKNLPPRNGVPISMNMVCQPCQYAGAYIDSGVEPPVYYGCPRERLVNGKYAVCLYSLTPEKIMETINE